MRFVFVGFPTSVFPEMILVAKKLRQDGHRIIYWIRASGFAPKLPAELEPLVDFKWNYDWSDPANPWLINNIEKFPPLTAADLQKFAPFEASILGMVSRFYPRMTTTELTYHYHLYLRCWKGLFKELRPDIIVFRTVPHEPTNMIIFLLARFSGIKTLIFNQLWVTDRILPMEDFTQSNPNLNILTSTIISQKGDDKKILPDDLSSDLKHYLVSQTTDTSASIPIYMPDLFSDYSIFNRTISRLRALFNRHTHINLKSRLINSSKTFGWWLISRIGNQLPRSYNRLVSEPDYSKPFIYFPLHLQPEFSTNPLGGYFRDQLLALEILAASLPQGWEIYVKEHPAQWLLGGTRYHPYRPKDYYHTIARLPAVRLISTTADSFKLIRQATAVATISGTAGWEAILRGKPALVFGHAWYQAAPGVFKIADTKSCGLALSQIKKGDLPNHQQAVLGFLKRLDENSFAGCLDLQYRHNPQFFKLTPEQQANNILEVIFKTINN